VVGIPVPKAPGRTLARRISVALAERILSGELPPGTRLKDCDVARQFGTSNTPVREAFRELARDGLVELHPYRGCVVLSADPGELAEILEVRAVLEAEAARLAAPRLTQEQLAELEILAGQCENAYAAGEPQRGIAADLDFHWGVVEAAGNETMARIVRELHARMRVMCQAHVAMLPASAEPTHHALLAALRSRDGGRASALMAEHIASQRRAMTAAPQDQQEEVQETYTT
jgi:DNA-binding GntR family transcriptional regulator